VKPDLGVERLPAKVYPRANIYSGVPMFPFRRTKMEAFTYAASTLCAHGPQERYSLIKTFMDFESKHNPRALHMWEKMTFQPNTFSPEDPLVVCSEQGPVSSGAPTNPYCKTYPGNK
jgi:hypothetical protein